MRVRSEENGGPEDTLESENQPAVLRSPLLHPESIEHLGPARKSNVAGLLPRSQSGEKERDEAILAPGKPVFRVTSDEQHKLAVTPFVHQGSGWRALDRQSAENEWAR